MNSRSPLQGGARRRRRNRSRSFARSSAAPRVKQRRRLPRASWLVVPLLFAAAAVAAWVVAGHNSSKGAGRQATATPVPRTKTSGPHVLPANAGPPGIQLGGPKPIRIHFKQPPKAGLLFDVHSGRVLWDMHPLTRLPIASVTKVMSAILDVEHTKPGDQVRITHEAEATTGSKVGELPKGRKVQAEALLAGMLLPSGND